VDDLSVDFLQPGEAREAAAVLGYAFRTNPNSIAIWQGQGDSERIKQAAIFRILKLQRPCSRVLVARRDDRIVGTLNMALWPGCQMSPLETAKLIPRMVLILKGAALRGAMTRAAKLQSVWAAHDPKEPHWHLGPLGVLPELQGQGIGKRLLERFCEMVDQETGTAYLETDRAENVPFYERFNFSIVAETEILGVPNWFMWRSRQLSESVAA
jgi:GNAT superfamily N-acetyltransferase